MAGRNGSRLPAASSEGAGGGRVPPRSTPLRTFSERMIGMNRECFTKPKGDFPVPLDEGLGVYGRLPLQNRRGWGFPKNSS